MVINVLPHWRGKTNEASLCTEKKYSLVKVVLISVPKVHAVLC